MACYAPLEAWKSPEGITFNAQKAWRDRPLQLACGQCIGCRIDRQSAWAIRAVHEAQMHERSSFLTLTYNDANLPPDGSLQLDHWTKFAKRLRKKLGPFRYLHCGEYGDQNLRPHYHAIIFGHDFRQDSIPVEQPGANPLWISAALTKLWKYGFHSVGECNYSTARYVASYTVKKITGKKATEQNQRVDPSTGECWDVKPEYATMSRRPGLGATWFEKYTNDVYPRNHVIIDGNKHKPPAFYDKLLERKDPGLHRRMLEQRRNQVRNNSDDYTAKRLAVRERVALAKHHNATNYEGALQ